MDNRKRGEELNQLSRLLFDKAACKWYRAIAIEVLAGVIGAVGSILVLPPTWELLVAIGGFFLLVGAY